MNAIWKFDEHIYYLPCLSASASPRQVLALLISPLTAFPLPMISDQYPVHLFTVIIIFIIFLFSLIPPVFGPPVLPI